MDFLKQNAEAEGVNVVGDFCKLEPGRCSWRLVFLRKAFCLSCITIFTVAVVRENIIF